MFSIKVFLATSNDLRNCRKFDTEISTDVLLKQINEQRVLLLSGNSQVIGYLRYSLFWSSIPYVDLIHVGEEFRRKGSGKALYVFLEKYLKQQGFKKLMASAQSNEPDAQNFHKKIGFELIGSLSKLNHDESDEIFFLKAL